MRRTWQQRPPLAPEKNPLLGRWESLGSGQRKGGAPGLSPEMAKLANALIGGITGGLCDSMLGRGTIEFRPAGLVAIGRDGREQPMYRAEYRGGGSRVVVLPQGGTTFTHMIIDFDGTDHATVAAVGCGLARAGGGAAQGGDDEHRRRPRRDAGAAPQWTLLGTSAANGGMDVYVAPATIRRSGDQARMLGPVRLQDAPGVRGQGLLLGAQRVRVRLRPAAPAHALDDRLFRADGQGRGRRFERQPAARGSRSAAAGRPSSTGRSPASGASGAAAAQRSVLSQLARVSMSAGVSACAAEVMLPSMSKRVPALKPRAACAGTRAAARRGAGCAAGP